MNSFEKFLAAFLVSFLVYLGAFLTVYALNLNHLTLQSEDYLGSTVLPFSLLYEGDFDLDEYYTKLTTYYPQPDNAALTPYYLRKDGEHYYSIRPIWTSLLALPVYLPARLMNIPVDIELIRIMSRIGGAFITALSCGLFYVILDKLLNKRSSKIFLFTIYAFATNSLSTSSQGLWQHGTSQFLICAGLLSLIKRNYLLTGFLLGLAVVSRPTNLLTLVAIGIYLMAIFFFQKKQIHIIWQQIGMYFTGGAAAILLEFTVNKVLFGIADGAAYSDQLNGWRNNIIEGFLGLWLSPSKGIFFNSPVLIFILYGFYSLVKKNFKINTQENENQITSNLLIPAGVIVFLHTLIMGWWYSWYGGYSWGYRMASDVLPFIVLMMIPFMKDFYEKSKLRITTLILLSLSILNHLAGLVFFDGIWHTIYDGKSRWWLWSIQNSEIIFDIKRTLYKLGISKTNPIPFGY